MPTIALQRSDLDPAVVPARVREPHARGDAARRPGVLGVLGPFDERDRVLAEKRVQQSWVFGTHAREPIEIEVRDGTVFMLVQVPDHERRRRDRSLHPQAPQRPAHERGLPRAQFTRHEHDVAGTQRGRQLARRRSRLRRVRESAQSVSRHRPGGPRATRSVPRVRRPGSLTKACAEREAGSEQEHSAARDEPSVDAGVGKRGAGGWCRRRRGCRLARAAPRSERAERVRAWRRGRAASRSAAPVPRCPSRTGRSTDRRPRPARTRWRGAWRAPPRQAASADFRRGPNDMSGPV